MSRTNVEKLGTSFTSRSPKMTREIQKLMLLNAIEMKI